MASVWQSCWLYFLITAYFEIGSMIGVLLGVMTLKVGAYMQPLLQKIKNENEGE